jgi:diguanylate cyclase (GGDEF)-like protein
MSDTAATSSATDQEQALPRMIHRVRASGFLMGFVILAAQMMGKGYSAWVWGLLVLQFFVYPHLLHWRTRRAAEPMQAALGNFLIDAGAMGLWAAGLGYPLWIAFTLLACSVVSITLYGGLRSAGQGILIFFLGGLLWLAFTGQAIDLHTDWPVTVLSIVGLMIFLLMTTNTVYRRNLRLRGTHEKLRASEQTVHMANLSLHEQLIEIHVLQDQLREQAYRDPLTGLYNRRYLDSTLERELSRCRREGQPLCLMLIDIDHFKRVNDTYGHQAGDEVLIHLASMLSAQARSADVVCRFGGEEFLLLLPNMPLSNALERAEQWRADFAATTVTFGEFRMQATLSFGISTYSGHGTSAAELIRRADQALYRAKMEGRNRIVVFSADTPAAGS